MLETSFAEINFQEITSVNKDLFILMGYFQMYSDISRLRNCSDNYIETSFSIGIIECNMIVEIFDKINNYCYPIKINFAKNIYECSGKFNKKSKYELELGKALASMVRYAPYASLAYDWDTKLILKKLNNCFELSMN